MRVNPAIAASGCFLASLTGPAGVLRALARQTAGPRIRVRQPIAIQFSFDRPIDASAAPFVLAAADGLFGSEGLAVTTNIANGSPDAIARVAAGTSDLALVDINALIRFRGKSGRAARQGGVRAVQQVALRHRCPQKPRHPRALRYRRQNARRRRGRSFDPAMAGAGAAERNQDRKREAGALSAPRCGSRCCRRARSMR